MKTIGIIPARMGSSRFPGKPLAEIHGKPMIEHVYCRAALFSEWSSLAVATCDEEIAHFTESKQFPTLLTSPSHSRCLDRVAEAITLLEEPVADNDIIVCVQGDEPMLHPEMIEAVIAPLKEDENVHGTVLAMDIVEGEQFYHPNTVKIIHDLRGDVLYTSRSPVPYCKSFSPELGAKRIYGIFGFRWHFLQTFNALPESPLEALECCDSNRILDNGYHQRIAPYPHHPSFSVDCPEDLRQVIEAMPQDRYWDAY